MELKKITIYQSLTDGGDGAPSINYFLTEAEAEKDQNDAEDGEFNYAEPTIEVIETYEGSNIHKQAK